MMRKSEVECPFYSVCKNAGKECHRCTMNTLLNISNYLIYNTDGKTIKYM